MKKYVFDLDNTLFYTDALNNESYNFALEQLKFPAIIRDKRITRDIVFSHYSMTEETKKQLTAIKQKYFISNLDKVMPNENLITFLKSLMPEECVLWTRAEHLRVECILDRFNLAGCFIKLFFSTKENKDKDIQEMCDFFGCTEEEIVIFDDEM